MPTALSEQTAKGSISRRFNLSLLAVYLLSILVCAPSIYIYTRQTVYAQANTQLGLMVDMVKAIKDYIAKDMRPFFVKEGLFHSAGISGIVAVSRVAQNFKELQANYSIRNVSDNPLNPANKPEPLENDLLLRFRANKTLTELKVDGIIEGQRMLVRTSPIVSAKGCLNCHGDPKTTPEQITKEYGTHSGYHYREGDIVGLDLVGVPMADVDAIALQRSATAVGLLTILFGAIFITINLLVRGYLISPILRITTTAQAIAKGSLDQPLVIQRNDEIGDLARSVELLRRSFAQLMKRMKKGPG